MFVQASTAQSIYDANSLLCQLTFYRSLFHCKIRLLRQSHNYPDNLVTIDHDIRIGLLRDPFAAPRTHS